MPDVVMTLSQTSNKQNVNIGSAKCLPATCLFMFIRLKHSFHFQFHKLSATTENQQNSVNFSDFSLRLGHIGPKFT